MEAGHEPRLDLRRLRPRRSLLAQQLLAEGYEVHGTSRDAGGSGFGNLAALGVQESVQLHSVAVNDFRSVLQTLTQVEPCEVYNLAGQSSVGLSFQQPVETLDSIARGTLNWLEAIRFSELPAKFYNACSGECFGNCPPEGATEETPFRPRSPYAVAKASAYWQVANYREAYSVQACSGILFNHESPLRSPRFVTSKIVSAVVAIAEKRRDELTLGNLDVQRDWGWAPEYVVAMRAMLQLPDPQDFVIATGQSWHLRDFVAAAFDHFDLDWRRYVRVDPCAVSSG